MGTYGETFGRSTPPVTTFRANQADPSTLTCDKCVAPSVAVVVVGEGPSALSLEFCGHHLAQLTAEFSDRGHQIKFHAEHRSAPTTGPVGTATPSR
jgi:hypothetical protein